jgi:hypothetical protein
MKKSVLVFVLFVVAGCGGKPELAAPPDVAPAPLAVPAQWIQLNDGGAAEIRAVVETPGGACPVFYSGGKKIALTLRAEADAKFATVCSAPVPKGAQIDGMPRINLNPQRILMLGDTGCRLKDKTIQNCNNPKDWPFPSVAAAAARLKPDLVLDVGDYQYRETPCPTGNAGCEGTPYGDNWPAWKADFFAPVAPLLAAAPWVFVRGNHEDCQRSGPGFLRMIGPLPFTPDCIGHLAPYRVPLGAFSLMVLDNADASDTEVDPKHVAVYQAELAEADQPSPLPVWLAMHRPIWAAVKGPLGISAGGNAQIIASAEKTMVTKPVELMLSGHIHTFEILNYAGGTPPPQLVGGNGGDNLDVTPANLKGTLFQGQSHVSVKDGLSVGGYGFLLLTRMKTGWTIDIYDSAGLAEGQCKFTTATDRLDCPRLPSPKAG